MMSERPIDPKSWPGPERAIRVRLGIPDGAQYVLVVDQAAHLDWDWTSTFDEYLTGVGSPSGYGVEQILTEAFGLLAKNPDTASTARYYYSLCEIGYLRSFVEATNRSDCDNRSLIGVIGDALRIVGGGITSPDCLVCSGEGFIRNYLVGKLWLMSNLPELPPLRHCWIPDDFGQDPELPVAVAALGLRTISFSRAPGLLPARIRGPLQGDLLTNGVDFWWEASDGTSVYAHWMPGVVPGYNQGTALSQSDGSEESIVAAISQFLSQYKLGDPTDWAPPYPASPSGYLYLPLDNDFMYPIADLLNYLQIWNDSGQQSGVYAMAASFDDFAGLVLSSTPSLQTRRFNGTPYYTGYYMSRPQNKVLHYGTTRALLAAEVFGLLAFRGPAATPESTPYWTAVSRAWNDFVPSTHHDYVTGTATDDVTRDEQIPLLEQAHREAITAVDRAIRALGASVGQRGDVVVVNPVGAPYAGPVELDHALPEETRSITFHGVGSPIQRTPRGSLFIADAPSMGYVTGTPSDEPAFLDAPATIEPHGTPPSAFTLTNGLISVVIDADSDWGISSITDADGAPVLAIGGVGNELAFYRDAGNMYQFANEVTDPPPQEEFEQVEVVIASTGGRLGASVVESGPVRVTLRTVISIQGAGLPAAYYTREYSLVAGERLLRMSTTGAAPSGYSIMTKFPLGQPVESIAHGTACHWTSTQPIDLWGSPTFRATHQFLLPQGAGRTLAAVYHPEVPAWAIDVEGALIGCLLRNTPGCSEPHLDPTAKLIPCDTPFEYRAG